MLAEPARTSSRAATQTGLAAAKLGSGVLEDFTAETFTDRIGDRFRLSADEATALDVELIEAAPSVSTSGSTLETPGKRTPFSLVFRGPPDPVLPQRIYRFEHHDLGAFEIFVVPVGRDADGVRYEAVFT